MSPPFNDDISQQLSIRLITYARLGTIFVVAHIIRHTSDTTDPWCHDGGPERWKRPLSNGYRSRIHLTKSKNHEQRSATVMGIALEITRHATTSLRDRDILTSPSTEGLLY